MNQDVFADVPTNVLIAVGVLVVVQLTLQIIALVSLVKTPTERVTIGGKKWIWAVIIILGEIIGPIIWFVAGRSPVQAAEVSPGTATADRARNAADALYGAPAASAAPPAAPAPAQAVAPAAESLDLTPEERAGDPEIGTDGTGTGELP